ncbi:CidA/LrgA family protein [Lentibacillus populi]|uniref:CidA/LrgA family protein n=1 Tax=Lentibacillus populi TaxID=1827502 RepID=UPI0025711998|nr:CidA/LrgA family protein [Lentibacillus populi]
MSSLLKLFKIFLQIAILYGVCLIGNGIQHVFHLFIPGSVIGMILLFVLLSMNIVKAAWIEDGANVIIKNLTLFFIPATVGILDYMDVFTGKGSLLIFIVLVSTVLVMAGSGFVSQWMMQRREVNHD